MNWEETSPANSRLLRLRALQTEADHLPVTGTAPFQGLKFILFRHGLSETNAKLANAQAEASVSGTAEIDKSFYLDKPDRENNLESEGFEQAIRNGLLVARHMREPDGPFKVETGVEIRVSPFNRTLQTWGGVKPALSDIDWNVSVDPRIEEKKFGKWDGKSDHERQAVLPAIFALSKQRGSYYVAPPDGESGQMIEQRVRSSLIDAADAARDRGFDTVMLITHRPVLEYASMILMGLPGNRIKAFPDDFGNCAAIGIADRKLTVLHHGFEPKPTLSLQAQLGKRRDTPEPEAIYA